MCRHDRQQRIHRRDVAAVFYALGSLIKADLSKHGGRCLQVPGMMRITYPEAGTPGHAGINPFTKEPVMFKAKPARIVGAGTSAPRAQEDA